MCAYCSHCKLDGWNNEPKVQGKESDRPDDPPNLFECTVCLDIVHPECADKTVGRGRINNGKEETKRFSVYDSDILFLFIADLSNSWECAKCINSGYSTVPNRQKRHNSGDSEDDQRFKKHCLLDVESPPPAYNN